MNQAGGGGQLKDISEAFLVAESTLSLAVASVRYKMWMSTPIGNMEMSGMQAKSHLCNLSRSSGAPWMQRLWMGIVFLLLASTSVFATQVQPAKTWADEKKAVAENILGHTTQALTLAQEQRDLLKSDEEAYYKLLEELLVTWVDFRGFARSVMGKFYKEATPEQFDVFANEFQSALLRTYALALNQINPRSLSLLPPPKPKKRKKQKKENKNRVRVMLSTRAKSGQVIPFQYSTVRGKGEDGHWQVRNLIVNGINLGLVYRSRFYSAMEDPTKGGDLDKVIRTWHEEGIQVKTIKDQNSAPG